MIYRENNQTHLIPMWKANCMRNFKQVRSIDRSHDIKFAPSKSYWCSIIFIVVHIFTVLTSYWISFNSEKNIDADLSKWMNLNSTSADHFIIDCFVQRDLYLMIWLIVLSVCIASLALLTTWSANDMILHANWNI